MKYKYNPFTLWKNLFYKDFQAAPYLIHNFAYLGMISMAVT